MSDLWWECTSVVCGCDRNNTVPSHAQNSLHNFTMATFSETTICDVCRKLLRYVYTRAPFSRLKFIQWRRSKEAGSFWGQKIQVRSPGVLDAAKGSPVLNDLTDLHWQPSAQVEWWKLKRLVSDWKVMHLRHCRIKAVGRAEPGPPGGSSSSQVIWPGVPWCSAATDFNNMFMQFEYCVVACSASEWVEFNSDQDCVSLLIHLFV